MGALSATVLRPRRTRRARSADPDLALVNDLLALLARLASDTAAAAGLRDALQAAFAAAAEAMVAQAGAGAERAAERLRAWIGGLVDPSAVAGALGEIRTPADAARFAEGVLDRLVALADGVDAATLRPHVETLLDILSADLGITAQAIEARVWGMLDDTVARVRALPADPDAGVMDARREAVRVIRELRRRLHGRRTVRTPSAAELAGVLAGLLRQAGADVAARRAACAGRGAADAAGAVARIAEAVPAGGSLQFRSVGAAAADATPPDTYCWYASWLLGERGRPWWMHLFPWPPDEVWATGVPDSGDEKVVRRNQLRADETLHSGRLWQAAPLFSPRTDDPWYSLGSDPDLLEKMAWISSFMVDFFELMPHVMSLEEGDSASNVLHTAGAIGHCIYKAVRHEPVPPWAEWWAYRLGGTFLTSLEGIHTGVTFWSGAGMWLTLFGPDLGEMVLYHHVLSLTRDVILGAATQVNQRYGVPAGAPAPANRTVVEPWTEAWTLAGLSTLCALFPRNRYSLLWVGPGDAIGIKLLFWLAGSLGNGLAAGFLGTIVGGAFAGSVAWKALPIQMATSAKRSLAFFWPWLYLLRDGDVDGRFNPAGTAEFAGYPEKTSSPYALPYAPGTMVYVGQANQGMWSHHHLEGTFNEVYAYDFSQDEDDEVLAARPGTVVDWWDWTHDDTNPGALETPPTPDQQEIITESSPEFGQTAYRSGNFIVVRHDRDENGAFALPLAGHDRGEGGAEVTTYAVYFHGRQGSVRDIFQTVHGVAGADIIGTPVHRGMPLMRAGNTGVSFHNHLHFDVRSGPAAPVPLPSPAPPPVVTPVQLAMLGTTIPMVFRDCSETDGRPRRLNFYASDNPRDPALP